MMKISCIICTKDRPQELKNCLISLMNQTILPIEIIIVDASAISNSCEVQNVLKQLATKGINVKYISAKPGLPSQRNIGISQAIGDIIFFFDDDVILEKNYLKEILKVYKEYDDGSLGGVQGTIKNLSPSPYPKRLFERLFMISCRATRGRPRLLRSGFPLFVPRPKNIIRIEIQMGGCASYKRAVFSLFKFDDRLEKCSPYGLMEDIDFSYQVSRVFKMYQTPFALLYHMSHSFASKGNDAKYAEQRVINSHYLFRKHFKKSLLNNLCRGIALLGLLITSLPAPQRLKGTINGILKISRGGSP